MTAERLMRSYSAWIVVSAVCVVAELASVLASMFGHDTLTLTMWLCFATLISGAIAIAIGVASLFAPEGEPHA